MTKESPFERIAVRIGWLFAALLVIGYFVVIAPKPVTAKSIVRDLQLGDVEEAHLLALSASGDERAHLEEALIAVAFTTNNWRLLHVFRQQKGVLPQFSWKVSLVHDSIQRGFQDYDRRPTEADVEEFLVREGWYFESTRDAVFLEGKVFTNAWVRALGYRPTHSWVHPTEVFSTNSLRIIEIMNSLGRSKDGQEQERLINEYLAIRKPPTTRRERMPVPSFLPLLDEGDYKPLSEIEDLQQVKFLIVADDSGTPPLFESVIIQNPSLTVLAKLRNLEKSSRWRSDPPH